MQNIFVVVDMQKDCIDGALGTKEAVAIVPNVVKKVEEFDGRVIFTRDTHTEDYMNTQEGHNLPVPHCIKGSDGWQICKELLPYVKEEPVDKVTFGSSKLPELLMAADKEEKIESITFVGLCTDICVISNVMVTKAFMPEVKVIVDAACCAGVTPESHRNALEAMKVCQVIVEE